jgi:hypothetical protein
MVQPRNYLLLACHAANESVQVALLLSSRRTAPVYISVVLTRCFQQTQFWRGVLYSQKNPYLEDLFFASLRATKTQAATGSTEASK